MYHRLKRNALENQSPEYYPWSVLTRAISFIPGASNESSKFSFQFLIWRNVWQTEILPDCKVNHRLLTYLAKISSLLLFDSIKCVVVCYYETLWNCSFSKYIAYFMVSALNVSSFPLFRVPIINWFLCTLKRAM
jgi:hypothetical protein